MGSVRAGTQSDVAKAKGRTCGLPVQVAVGKLGRAMGLKVFAAKVHMARLPRLMMTTLVRLAVQRTTGGLIGGEQP